MRETSDAPRRVETADPVRLLEQIYPRLMRSARLVAEPGQHEDLVQEALIRILGAYPGFVGLENPVAYGRVVIARLAAKQRRTGSISLDSELSSALVDPNPSPELAVIGQANIERILSELPTRQRACLYLRIIHGLDEGQTARVLGCRRSTVRSQLSRGLRHLRQESPPEGMSNA